jgi:ubiquinone/menaquinone biosynthesis C-methylase UbiE
MPVEPKVELVRGMADAYGRYSEVYASVLDPTLEPMTEQILDIGRTDGRQRILDLATGTGRVARAAARRGNWVVGVDISVGIVRTARRLSSDALFLMVADAAAQPVAARSFDLVTCALSLSHFRDVSTVLREVRRVLRPGGCFVATAWDTSNRRDPSFVATLDVVKRYMTTNRFSALVDDEPWASSERGCEIMRRAGFDPVRVTILPLSGVYVSPGSALEWAFAWPLIGEVVDVLDAGSREVVRTEALAAIRTINDLSWRRIVNYYAATEPRDDGGAS